ncbi:MAG: hypothetical protein JWM97_188, partial [Phycisphaerales bacterium]|nr:hypothetical protein [Phycisphaerales bacterium]
MRCRRRKAIDQRADNSSTIGPWEPVPFLPLVAVLTPLPVVPIHPDVPAMRADRRPRAGWKVPMAPQSRAHKRLVRLYRLVIWRMRVHCAVARREFLERLPLRLHVELLQPRMLMSVAPAGGELLLNQAIGS